MRDARLFSALDMESYIRDQVPGCALSLSASIAHILLSRSPLHARWQHPRLSPAWEPRHKREYDLGSAAHAMLVENQSGGLVVINARDYRSKAAAEQRDAAYAAWRTPVLATDIGRLEAMVSVARAAIDACPDLADVPRGTLLPERTIAWREGEAMCRCRPDWITPDRTVTLSYKTTGNAEPDTFARIMVGSGYDLQAAFECAALQALTGEMPRYVWIAQETEPPYACSLLGLSPMMADLGARKLARAVEIWGECLRTGVWPSYPDRIAYIDPPEWAIYRWGEKEQAEGPPPAAIDDGRPLDEQLWTSR